MRISFSLDEMMVFVKQTEAQQHDFSVIKPRFQEWIAFLAESQKACQYYYDLSQIHARLTDSFCTNAIASYGLQCAGEPPVRLHQGPALRYFTLIRRIHP